MFRAVAKLLVLLAAVQILGGHWAVLQSVAWTGMLIDNLRGRTVVEAVERTFSGKAPCKLCVAVKQGRETESKQATAKLVVKLDAVLAPKVALPARAEAPMIFFTHTRTAEVRSSVPLLPPPRLA